MRAKKLVVPTRPIVLASLIQPEHVDLREARLRAELHGEADPALHAIMAEALMDAAEILNGKDFVLTDDRTAPLAIAETLREVEEKASEIHDEHEKNIEELKSEAAKERDEAEARYDAMVDERNAWQDKTHAAEEKLRELEGAAGGLDTARVEKIRAQERSLEVLARAIVASVCVLGDQHDAAVTLARAVLEQASPAAPRARKRVAKGKP